MHDVFQNWYIYSYCNLIFDLKKTTFLLKNLYFLFNCKKNQLYLNILNKKKKTLFLLTTGLVLKFLKYQSKSAKRSLKGIMLFCHFLKKIIYKKYNTNFLTLIIKKWQKNTFFFFKQLKLLFSFLKKQTNTWQTSKININFVWVPAISYTKFNYKKIKSIKRRLKKKLILKDNVYYINI